MPTEHEHTRWEDLKAIRRDAKKDSRRERFLSRTVCRVLGHRPRPKMSCTICGRCRRVIYTPRA